VKNQTDVIAKRLLAKARMRHLQVFVAVADTLSVQRAAEAAGVTQPTASQALLDLEALVQRKMFLRHSRGMALTAAGAALLPLARRALSLVDEVATAAAGLDAGAQSVVRVAGISAAARGFLGPVLTSFARAFPDVLVLFEEHPASRHAGLVADGLVDCLLARRPEALPGGWVFHPLWEDHFAVITNPRHPLVRRKRLTHDDLVAARWLVTPAGVVARHVFDALFEGARPSTHAVVTTSVPLACSLLEAEPLLALLPVSLARPELTTGQLVELRWSVEQDLSPVGLLAPKSARSTALERFANFVMSTASGIQMQTR
jgi:DNA-binding transcriptional LysR family regulator